MGKQTFFSRNAFEEALYSSRAAGPGSTRSDPFAEAAHFVGGAMLRDGFRLFRNGGLPLLERREGSLVEEVLLHERPGGASGRVEMTVRVHLSHTGLRDVRARYWTTPARAPTFLAGGNVGELEAPPGWVMWDVTDGGKELEELAIWLRSLVLPWFELFEEPDRLRALLLREPVPLLSRVNALEWMLAEFGARESRTYYSRLLEWELSEPGSETHERLLNMAACYRLR